jgi:integrase
MGRRFLLTYDKSLRQWVKRINGRKFYFGKGSSKTNREDYERAERKYFAFLPTLSNSPSATITPKQTAQELSLPAETTSVPSRTPASNRISRIAERYLSFQDSRINIPRESGGICAARAKAIRYWLRPFLKSFGDLAMTPKVLGDLLSRYRTEQLASVQQDEVSPNTLFQRFATLKNFLRWSWEHEYLRELPRNVRSDLRFGMPQPDTIHIFDWRKGRATRSSEVCRLLDAVAAKSEMLELFVLLGLNCGFGMSDIANLKMQDVLWRQSGPTRIKRLRPKTKVPSNHLLWDRTLELLKKYADGKYGSSEPCFKRTDGSPLIAASTGIYTSNFVKMFKETVREVFGKDDPRSFKTLRKTTATFCRQRMPNTEVADLFLAHKPRLISQKFYTFPSYALLDEVLCYCECDFGLTDTVSDKWQRAKLKAPLENQ